MLKRTISGMVGKGSFNHNNRDFIAKNVDQGRTQENVVFRHENLRQVYQKLFGKALERYNVRQKRNDRKIADYYNHIQSGRQEKLYHEVIFQIGSGKDTAVGTPEAEQAQKILTEFMAEFQIRNPNLYVFSAYLHMDEATPHLHIDFVPYITGSKRGLDTRVSLKKALAAQGFEGGSREDTEINQWIYAEKQMLAQVMERHSMEWKQLGIHNEHLSVLDYKKQERAKEVQMLEKRLDNLHEKQVNIQAVEQIQAQKVPLTTKVMISKMDYDQLTLMAQKNIEQVKRERKLQHMLAVDNETISQLTKKIDGIEKELYQYRSIKGQLKRNNLELENKYLKKELVTCKSIIKSNGLSHLLQKLADRKKAYYFRTCIQPEIKIK
ncbi:plasmid recombination protein [Ethanoligenens sp.]|uniref:plasmid recombination protein n=1 Tax=Ethanoligenens sp. TaxID=2099655 RepID=UPI0039EABAD5